MKDKAIFIKWWFWVVILIVLGGIGSLGQSGKDIETNTTNQKPSTASNSTAATLPQLTTADYKGKEGLVVYKDLKAKGYAVDADFENQALTDINGKASTVFEPLDARREDDRQSVDVFVVGEVKQTGDSVKLIIVKSVN